MKKENKKEVVTNWLKYVYKMDNKNTILEAYDNWTNNVLLAGSSVKSITNYMSLECILHNNNFINYLIKTMYNSIKEDYKTILIDYKLYLIGQYQKMKTIPEQQHTMDWSKKFGRILGAIEDLDWEEKITFIE